MAGSRRGAGSRRRGPAVLAAWAAALALAGGAGAGLARSPRPAIHTVTIDATSYQPAQLTVHAGDTIVWENKDLFPHTVTGKAGAFDSEVLVNGKSWHFLAKRKGTFDYACVFHPVMKGRLTVE